MTPLLTIAIVATAILGLAYFAARGLREGWRAVETYRRGVAQVDAADDFDRHCRDAQMLAAIGRHPVSQRPSVADWWQARFPAGRTHPILRLIEGDQ